MKPYRPCPLCGATPGKSRGACHCGGSGICVDAHLATCVVAAAGQSIDSAVADALCFAKLLAKLPLQCTRLLFNGHVIIINSDDTLETVLARWCLAVEWDKENPA